MGRQCCSNGFTSSQVMRSSCTMAGMVDSGINNEVLESIRDIAQKCGVSRVVLFGSRARGEQRPKSDIDLAVYGGDQVRFSLDVDEEAPTLLQFDFVDMDGSVSQELRDRVAQEGVVLYEEVR